MLEKIAKLLNQAENAGTAEEAATFMEKAQSLATLHQIELAKARLHTESKQRTRPIQETIVIGQNIQGLKTLADLFAGIAKANDVEILYAPNGSKVYAYGFEEDIALSKSLYASLLVQQSNALEEFKNKGDWKNDQVYHEGYYQYVDQDGKACTKREACDRVWIDSGWRAQTWRTARLNFQDGYAKRIRSRLMEAKLDEIERRTQIDEESEAAGQTSTTLALREKKAEIATIFQDDYNRATTGYQSGSSGASSHYASHAGRQAANQARLSSQQAIQNKTAIGS